MAELPVELVAMVALRDGSEVGTGLTADDTDILGTDLVDARIESFKLGIFWLHIEVLDFGSSDETYTVALLGRNANSGSYTTLASITPTAVGFHMTNVDGFKDRLNYSIDVAGTTPTLTFSAGVFITQATYQPLGGAIITA